jgi:hypothetical protein
MLFYMVLGRIDIAAAERATEFSHSLQDIRIKSRPLI